MSLRSLIHNSRLYKRLSYLPSEHRFRRSAKLYPYPVLPTHFLLDPFDWALLLAPSFMGAIIFFILFIINILFEPDGSINPWVIIPLFVFMFIAIYTSVMSTATERFFDSLRLHLGVKNLQLVIKLSPSRFEDMCNKRLQTLATSLEEVQRQTLPYDKSYLEAREIFSNAFDFFSDQGFIKAPDWRPFFSPTETRK